MCISDSFAFLEIVIGLEASLSFQDVIKIITITGSFLAGIVRFADAFGHG